MGADNADGAVGERPRELTVSTRTGVRRPYPGMTPFEPTDQAYFFGREAQTVELIERLRKRRFVSVIGGSGTGKSSLVMAGVIPELRTQALEVVGDFWVPVTMRPGTNKRSVEDSATHRLAAAFAQQLSGGADRIPECLDALRNARGLHALVDRFGRELADNHGVDLTDARVQVNFLFLIDQFEELFHDTNLGQAELRMESERFVRLLVEHFRDPTPSVCVALTMRNEYLSECSQFPGLVEAINSTFYLVESMQRADIHAAIVQPAQRRLADLRLAERKEQVRALAAGRDAPPESTLASAVAFDPDVVTALLDESDRVLAQRDHTDHLPLLQHLLYWLWECACERSAPAPIPSHVTLADLHAAVLGRGAARDAALPQHMFDHCLDQRCEEVFRGHPERQAAWQRVFRLIAYREPRTGTYTQERRQIPAADRAATEAQFEPWLAPNHPYLVLEGTLPGKDALLKVAHETLIRRWARLRSWVDADARLFHDYRQLVRDSVHWADARAEGRKAKVVDADRLDSPALNDIEQRLEDEAYRQRYGTLLARDVEAGLDHGQSRVGPYLAASRAARDEQRRLVKRHKVVLRLGVFAVVAFVGVAVMYFVQGRLTDLEKAINNAESSLRRSYALAAEAEGDYRPVNAGWHDWRDTQLYLRSLENAHMFYGKGKGYVEDVRKARRNLPFDALATPYAHREEDLRRALRLSEHRLSSAATTILGSAVFLRPTEAAPPAQSRPRTSIQVLPSVDCRVSKGSTGRTRLKLDLYLPGTADLRFGAESRGLAVRAINPNPALDESRQIEAVGGPRRDQSAVRRPVRADARAGRASQSAEASTIYEARFANGNCTLDTPVFQAPPTERARFGLSADLSSFVLQIGNVLTIYDLEDNKQRQRFRYAPTVQDGPTQGRSQGGPATSGERERGGANSAPIPQVLESWSDAHFKEIEIGGSWLRLIAGEATPTTPKEQSNLVLMTSFGAETPPRACRRLAEVTGRGTGCTGAKTQHDPRWYWAKGDNDQVYCAVSEQDCGSPDQSWFDLQLFRLDGKEMRDGNTTLPVSRQTLRRGRELDVALKDGWVLFKTEQDGWFERPWSVDAWMELMKGVRHEPFDDRKDESCESSTADSCLAQQSLRRPFNLIRVELPGEKNAKAAP